jgi:hypothetical protein
LRRPAARQRTIAAAALALGCALSCQLFVDVGGLSNGECGDGYKACDNMCVPETDIAYGCNSPGCAPCAFPNSYADCDPVTKTCVNTRSCVGTYATCPGDDGCGTDIAHDPNNCSGCGVICKDPLHGTAGCASKACAVGACDDGWEDCDHDFRTGCETNLRQDPANCGACGRACDAGVCDSGVCQTSNAPDAGVD